MIAMVCTSVRSSGNPMSTMGPGRQAHLLKVEACGSSSPDEPRSHGGTTGSREVTRPRNLFGADAVSRHVVLRPVPDLAADLPRLDALAFDVTRVRVKPTADVRAALIE